MSTSDKLCLNCSVRFVDLRLKENAVFAAEGGAALEFSKIVEKHLLQGSLK